MLFSLGYIGGGVLRWGNRDMLRPSEKPRKKALFKKRPFKNLGFIETVGCLNRGKDASGGFKLLGASAFGGLCGSRSDTASRIEAREQFCSHATAYILTAAGLSGETNMFPRFNVTTMPGFHAPRLHGGPRYAE